jgi:hypothetical protein
MLTPGQFKQWLDSEKAKAAAGQWANTVSGHQGDPQPSR